MRVESANVQWPRIDGCIYTNAGPLGTGVCILLTESIEALAPLYR